MNPNGTSEAKGTFAETVMAFEISAERLRHLTGSQGDCPAFPALLESEAAASSALWESETIYDAENAIFDAATASAICVGIQEETSEDFSGVETDGDNLSAASDSIADNEKAANRDIGCSCDEEAVTSNSVASMSTTRMSNGAAGCSRV